MVGRNQFSNVKEVTMSATIYPKFVRTLDVLSWAIFAAALILLALALISGCGTNGALSESSNVPPIPDYVFEATGEEFLISALDEINSISDLTSLNGSFTGVDLISPLPSPNGKRVLAKTGTDTVYVYGEVTPEGYGAVVTERFAHPKGLLLITVRKTYGREDGHAVTQTKRYISNSDLLSDNPQYANTTELYACSVDTIVTRVLRNETLETYTFRLPVITRMVNPLDGSIRVTTRYGAGGAVVSEVRDGDGNLIQLRRTNGLADGSLVVRTEFPDGTWRQIRTRGQADGSILREVTSSP
jgi:hypothetical protein